MGLVRAEERVAAEAAAAPSADTAEASTAPSSDTCRPGAPPRASSAAALAEIRAKLAARAAAGAGDVVDLDNHGQRYGEPVSSDPELLEFEARQQGR
jgi:hypothetical protein